ncbi:hypothetical protein KSD_25590 [Ktedonobacter sp. SOSP1-85]|uniref:hypothetical protein n=1 Tax=Ktedonobacter sp. SOSP1-85 TaxID=2778367 RepID=UPI0019161388|nr:hypothetical protein [Ktedonobacter sp. SOSP1-85]GHO74788.1 hypothetical protein KSD_25590 [Ktedonobacter sp. SOSP1-85]
MLQDMRKYAWLIIPLLVALIVGIVLGIAIPQNSLNTAIPLLGGWLFLPYSLSVFNGQYIDYTTHVPTWLIQLIFLSYVLAMLVAVGSTWGLRRTWKKSRTLLWALVMACVSVLVSIPVSLLAPSLNDNGIMITPALVFFAVWANLLFSALLGWGIGCLIPRHKLEPALPLTTH